MSSQTGPSPANRPGNAPPGAQEQEPDITPEHGLIRELWALLLVYGALIIVPLLTGIACES